ncbi:hypothetical protein F511_41841 [Dorcoceras hygrometricum]|uniref:Uncharacterized protein n=1 Tax=Dorcoceras hygrometricum TaxID=472368 RepID=A0A2Z7D9R7_9LAMI|nr:hypothetical protein F511_41841 [Dorcoceras hygrometricum]
MGEVSSYQLPSHKDKGDQSSICVSCPNAKKPKAKADIVQDKDWYYASHEEPLSSKSTDEELMSIDDLLMQISDDMMLPSVSAAEITNIKYGLTMKINEVQDKDWYYASLPTISANDKGKEPLEAADVVKGKPAREIVTTGLF